LLTGADQDFCIRLALHGPIGMIDTVLGVMHSQPLSLSKRLASREFAFVLPMIERHCRALKGRLTETEISEILGERYSHIGQANFVRTPLRGIYLIFRAVLFGYRRTENLCFIASAPVRILRYQWRLRMRPTEGIPCAD
jgi:hypothetical protein